MLVGIHQSQFIPWLPYWSKIFMSERFVVLDHVQYQKNGVQNRNQIKTPNGEGWLTIPIKNNLGQSIQETRISDFSYNAKILKTIEMNYKKSPFFLIWFEKLSQLLLNEDIKTLHHLNFSILQMLMGELKIKRDIIISSKMGVVNKKEDMVLEILEKTNGKEYLTGTGALDYMNLKNFKKNEIKVYKHAFEYKEYPQLWNKRQGFIPNLSILDLLFNLGGHESVDYISKNGKIERLV